MIDAEGIIQEFVEYQQAMNMALSTIKLSESALRKFFHYLEREGIEQLNDVDTNVMLKYQIHLSKQLNKNGKPYNPRTQNAELSNIRKMFKYLRKTNKVFVNPTADMELAKTSRPLPTGILSFEEAESLLDAPSKRTVWGKRNRAMLACLYDLGLRRGECRGLDLNDIYISERKIHIRQGKGSKDRVIPIQPDLAKRLKVYIEQARPLIVDDPDEQAVFLNKYGGRMSGNGILRIVKQEAKKAGIEKDIHAHTLRHCIATHLADNGAGIIEIQQVLGHSRADTSAIYIHLSGSRLRKVLDTCHPRAKIGEKVA